MTASKTPRLLASQSTTKAGTLITACLALGACEAKVKYETATQQKQETSEGDAEAPVLPACEDLGDGTPCDDGRHCIAGACVHNTCGDGVVAGDEECDDGDELIADRCNPACKLTPITCGNARVEADEECDDGNQNAEDACSTGCTFNVCGNGRRDAREECDDGNQVNDDYCADGCTRNLCRNGRLDPGEECDDGNAVHTDGCTNDCRKLGCGDGKLYAEEGPLKEECDDGNQVDTDKCSNTCKVNACGNKRLDPGELCDSNETDQGECNDTCSGWESPRCNTCMKDKCSDYFGTPGKSLYDPCFVEATPDNLLLGNTPPANFVASCTAFDRCIRNNRCAEVLEGDQASITKCFCGTSNVDACLTYEDILHPPAPAPVGPCAMEAVTAIGSACEKSDGNCVVNSIQDLSRASGHAFFLAECRIKQCKTECAGM